MRALWDRVIMMTTPMGMRSSGSPGKLAAVCGLRPVLMFKLYQHQETSKYFPESGSQLG